MAPNVNVCESLHDNNVVNTSPVEKSMILHVDMFNKSINASKITENSENVKMDVANSLEHKQMQYFDSSCQNIPINNPEKHLEDQNISPITSLQLDAGVRECDVKVVESKEELTNGKHNDTPVQGEVNNVNILDEDMSKDKNEEEMPHLTSSDNSDDSEEENEWECMINNVRSKTISKKEVNKMLGEIEKEGRRNDRELESRQYRLLRKQWESDSEDECEVNKVAKLTTELAKRKYKFPTPENEEKLENMVTTDDRTVLEVYRDIIDAITDKYTEEELKFLSSVVGFDASLRHYSDEGVPLPDTLVKQLSSEYKKMHDIHNINKAYEELRGLKVAKKVKKKVTKYKEQEEDEEEGAANLVSTITFPVQQLKDFIEFVEKDPSVLTSVKQRRQATVIKKMIKLNKNIGNKSLHKFLVNFNERYFWNGKYVEPVKEPQVLMLAAGDRLVYAQCSVPGGRGNVDISWLVDSGATHNILPKKIIDKHNIKTIKWQPRRGFPLKTAGQKVNNAILSECVVRLEIMNENKIYFIEVPFLVCNEHLQLSMPILGKSFLNEFNSNEKHRSETNNEDSYRLTIEAVDAETNRLSRVTLPTTEWPGSKNTDLYNIQIKDTIPNHEKDDLKTNINAIKVDDNIGDVLTSLGGDGVTIEQPIREDLDEAAYREVDLMEALEATPPPIGPKKPNMFANYDKYMERIEKINQMYEDAYARGDIQCGEFRLGLEVDPEIKDGMTAKQAKRSGQDHSTFAAVQKQMDKLESQGIIEVSNDQEAAKFAHNLLCVPKKPAGSTLRQWTKADQAIVGRQQKMNTEDLSIRVLADLTTLNKILKQSPSITLPEETEVKSFIKNKLISLYDIKNGYFSLRVKESAKVLFNFYYKNMIYTYARMPQGMSSSPFYFMCAMAKMLGQSAWDDFYDETKTKQKHIFNYASCFADITKYYLDDVVLASPLICSCNGHIKYNCEKGFNCAAIDIEQSVQLHIECHEAIVFAVRRSGMLLEKSKCVHFAQSSFVFLGVEYCGTESTYSISKERVASVLSFRVPRSIAELNSRLSSIFYSGPFLPYLKKLSLRLTRLVRSGHFVWGAEEMKCYNNLKLLSAIAISKSFYDPKAHLFLMADSSKFSGSYCIYQLLQNGEMQLIETDTVALSGAESRNAPVQRELSNLVWAVTKAEKYLLSTLNRVHVVGDALCIQYLKGQKHWDSRCGNIALILSKYDKLSFLYVPGRFLGLVDHLSRQFHDVFIAHAAGISKELSQVLAPLPDHLKNKIYKMSAQELTNYMMSPQKPAKIDVFDKASFCTQNYRAEDIKILFNEAGPIQSLISFLKDPYNPRFMSTNSAKHFFGVLTAATKTRIDKFIKDQSLDKLREVLKDIDFKTTWRQFYPSAGLFPRQDEPVVEVNMLTRSKATPCSLDWKEGLRCVHTEELKDTYKLADLKKYALNGKKFKSSITHLKKYWLGTGQSCNSDLMRNVEKFLESTCIVQRFALIKDIARILRENPADEWFLQGNQIKFIPYFCDESSDVIITEKQGDLFLTLDRNIKLECMEFLRINCEAVILDGESVWTPCDLPKLRLYEVSTVVPHYVTSSVTIFNITAKSVTLNKGTTLFKLNRPGQGDRISSYLKLKHGKGQKLLQGISDLQFNAGYTNLENIFSEYLCQAHVNLISPVVEGREGMGKADVNNIKKLISTHQNCVGEQDGFINYIESRKKQFSKRELYDGEFNLQALLFGHYLRQNNNKLTKDDIISLQASDKQVVKLIKKIQTAAEPEPEVGDETGRDKVKFFLRDGILYRKCWNKVRNITFTNLVLPSFLMREICMNLHRQKQIHINAGDTVALIKTAFWSYNMFQIAKSCQNDCVTCIYAARPRRRKTRGDLRLHNRDNMKIKSVVEVDLMFLPRDNSSSTNTDTCIVFTEPKTNFTTVYAIRDKSSKSIIKAIGVYVSSVGLMDILKSDRGSEFNSKPVNEFLTSLGIAQHISATKNSTSSVERQIQEIKAILNQLIQRAGVSNSRWGDYLPMTCVIHQLRPVRKGSLLSRLEAFMSPLHYQSRMFRLLSFNDGKPILDMHKVFCSDNQLRARARSKSEWEPGQLAKTHITRDKQKSVGGSAQLLPTCDRFIKITRPVAGGQAILCTDLLTEQELKFDRSEVKSLDISDLPVCRDIMIKNMNQFIPEESRAGSSFARQIFDTNIQPRCFNIEEISKLKSCLTKKPRFKRIYSKQFKGCFDDTNMKSLLKGYLRAYKLRKDLKDIIPDWLKFLVEQPRNYGKIRSLLDPLSDPAPPKVRHERKVTWAGDLVERKQLSVNWMDILPATRKYYSVSQKELISCGLNVCFVEINE